MRKPAASLQRINGIFLAKAAERQAVAIHDLLLPRAYSSWGIESAGITRVAATDPANPLPGASNRTVLADRLDEIVAAAGREPTLPPDPWRECPLIHADPANQHRCKPLTGVPHDTALQQPRRINAKSQPADRLPVIGGTPRRLPFHRIIDSARWACSVTLRKRSNIGGGNSARSTVSARLRQFVTTSLVGFPIALYDTGAGKYLLGGSRPRRSS